MLIKRYGVTDAGARVQSVCALYQKKGTACTCPPRCGSLSGFVPVATGRVQHRIVASHPRCQGDMEVLGKFFSCRCRLLVQTNEWNYFVQQGFALEASRVQCVFAQVLQLSLASFSKQPASWNREPQTQLLSVTACQRYIYVCVFRVEGCLLKLQIVAVTMTCAGCVCVHGAPRMNTGSSYSHAAR